MAMTAKTLNPTVTTKSPGDVDGALKYLNEVAPNEAAEVDEKGLVRKVDWTVVPLMFLCYNLQFLDKTLINYANVMGLQPDTGITGTQFSLLALLFYVTYLACELPTGYLLQRLPSAKYLGVNVMLWGLIVALNSAAHNWAALAALRAVLGVFESVVAPAFILISSMWYKRSEQPARVGFWYLGAGTGGVIGALTSFGFQHYTGKVFTSWQIMFLLYGLLTIMVGVLVILFLPDSPMAARHFTQAEKVMAINRLRENKTGVENKHFKMYQVWDCFMDPQTWLLALITMSASVPNGAVSSFQATIIKSFGYTPQQTALLSIPSSVILGGSGLAAGILAGHYHVKGPLVMAALLVGGVLGGALMAFLPASNKAGLLAGNYLTNFSAACLPVLYAYSAGNFAGHTKKVTMNAVLLIAYCVGNIIGPLTFRDQDAPAYIPAKITIMVSSGVAVVLTAILIVYYLWENQRRDRLHAGAVHVENSEFFDLTDRENKEFRYQW